GRAEHTAAAGRPVSQHRRAQGASAGSRRLPPQAHARHAGRRRDLAWRSHRDGVLAFAGDQGLSRGWPRAVVARNEEFGSDCSFPRAVLRAEREGCLAATEPCYDKGLVLPSNELAVLPMGRAAALEIADKLLCQLGRRQTEVTLVELAVERDPLQIRREAGER